MDEEVVQILERIESDLDRIAKVMETMSQQL